MPNNWAQVHLLVNHVPILGSIFAFLFLLVAWAMGNQTLIRTGLVLFVLGCIATVAVFMTGDPAADVVRRLVPDVARGAIRAHDSMAGKAATASFVAAVIALVGLVAFRRRAVYPGWFLALVLVAGLATSGLMAYTGHLGGKIRHDPELTTPASQLPPPPPRPAGPPR